MNQNTASRKVLADSQNVKFPYTIDFKGLKVSVHKNVFSPKFFNGWHIFTLNFPSVKGKEVLEIGCGTGVTSLYLAKNGAKKVVAADISTYAVKNTKENIKLNKLKNMEARKSNIFSGIKKNEKFDIVYWNMPFMYQRPGYKYKSVLERGLFDPGYKITDKFLREAKKFLKPGGAVLVGTGNFGDLPKFQKLVKKYDYKAKLLSKQKSQEINPVDFQLYSLTV